MRYAGEIAAVLTSVFFSISAVISTRTSQQVGALITNRVRLVLALIYLLVINLILFGQPLPIGAGLDRWIWLSLSGIVGLALGDTFLYHAYTLIGARLGMLLLSLAPVIGALSAWIVFGEVLSAGQIAGMTITLIGIAWVIMTRPNGATSRPTGYRRGLVFGVLAAAGQALGLVLSKQGLAGDFPAFAGNAIRMSAAASTFWLLAATQRQVRPTLRITRAHPATLKLLAVSALVGSVLGVTTSLYAVQHAPIGVASTLMSLPPVFLLPISYFIFKDRFGWQAVAGTFVALLGVALLFLG